MEKTLILFLSASPINATEQGKDTPFIQAYKDIERKLDAAKFGKYFCLEQAHRVSVAELQELLLAKYTPQILHFYGHGENRFLLLEDEEGNIEEAKLKPFADMFELLNGRAVISDNKKIRCVILVACDSERIAKAISEYVDCTIGMKSEIPADVGRDFAESFYFNLFDGQSVAFSFKMACIRIGMTDPNDRNTPIIVPRNGCDPGKMVFVPPPEFSGLSGFWHGVHLSRDSKGESVFSRHKYSLEIDQNGLIEGTVDELSANPPYKYTVNGAVRYGGMLLSGEIKSNTPTYAWFFNVLYDQNVIPGFIFSKDFEDKPFASYIILSRTIIGDRDYLAYLKEAKKRFYFR